MKSYFANSFRIAMEQARKEMGPEAVLVTTRTSSPNARHLGEYEVVFAAGLSGADEGGGTAAGSPAETEETVSWRPVTFAPPAPAPSPLAGNELAEMLSEIQGLRQQIQTWRQMHQPGWDNATRSGSHSPLEELLAELVRREVDRDTAQQLITAAENRLRTSTLGGPNSAPRLRRGDAMDRERARAVLSEVVQESFEVDDRLCAAGDTYGPRMVALVGPPGAGKTTTIAKLAVQHGLVSRKQTVLISLETLRVGASEQLRCYASLLGLGFQVVETNRALEQSLEEHRNKDLILIDTPGFALSDLAGGSETAEFLARRPDIQKHLVLPAWMRRADLSRTAAAYQAFRPSRLIFTRMDETETFGPVLCEAISSARPISYVSTGQRVPEDLRPARKPDLAALLLPAVAPSSTQSATVQAGALQSAA